MKNILVVPAYICLLSPSGSRYIASGGPPECATMVVMPEVTPAATALGDERGFTRTSPPALNHKPTNSRVTAAITMAIAR